MISQRGKALINFFVMLLCSMTLTRVTCFATTSQKDGTRTSSELNRWNIYATRGTASYAQKTPKSEAISKQRSNTSSEESHSRNSNEGVKSSPEREKLPWKAGYYTSLKTQKRIKNAGEESKSRSDLERATHVLKTFLSIPPERCNAANLVCALTLSAKLLGRSSSDEFRQLFFKTIDILRHLLQEDALSTRQLCNSIWAIAKHYDRDPKILPFDPEQIPLSIDGKIAVAETWNLSHDPPDNPPARNDLAINEIAVKLEKLLEHDKFAAKEGELSMACWAYGILRQRRRPPGWKIGPRLDVVREKENQKTRNDANFLIYEKWGTEKLTDECLDFDPPSPTDLLFDRVAQALCKEKDAAGSTRIQMCRWSELASIAWAYANHGYYCSEASELMLQSIAKVAAARLIEGGNRADCALSRDIAQIIWSLGTMQSDNFRLADGLVHLIDSFTYYKTQSLDQCANRPFQSWSCADIVQVCLSLAHARYDKRELLQMLYLESTERLLRLSRTDESVRSDFQPWEISILLWAQARLHLKGPQGKIFPEFTSAAVNSLYSHMENDLTFERMGIGPQEEANIIWSLTVLEEDRNENAIVLISRLFAAAATRCDLDGLIQLEHAHQLWQALFILEESSPEAVRDVPRWFRDYLEQKWHMEKNRPKISSARHRSLSQTLDLMGISHYNEHDEDIDVAIVLNPRASWSYETSKSESTEGGVKLAVEFDGPNHFTRVKSTDTVTGASHPRALGHTVLKYRLLKKQGWTVVRVPYYEFDKIPFWASQERCRYLQRLLKTHPEIRFSSVDFSLYKAPVANKKSRFD